MFPRVRTPSGEPHPRSPGREPARPAVGIVGTDYTAEWRDLADQGSHPIIEGHDAERHSGAQAVTRAVKLIAVVAEKPYAMTTTAAGSLPGR